jgi:hypothetical protein
VQQGADRFVWDLEARRDGMVLESAVSTSQRLGIRLGHRLGSVAQSLLVSVAAVMPVPE